MTSHPKRVIILVENYYEDLELWYPKIFLSSQGIKVVIAGKEKKTYRGKNGYLVEPEVLFSDLKAGDWDAVIIPGGFAPDYLRRSKEVLDFVREMDKKKKIVAAICHAGWVLVSAGIIRGRRVTSYFAIKDDVKNAGADFVDQPVVTDGNLITSRAPADLPYFCEAIVKALV